MPPTPSPASPKESLGAARTHLACVSDELREVRQTLARARGRVSLETAAAVTQAVRHTRQLHGGSPAAIAFAVPQGRGQGQGQGGAEASAEDLERRLWHVEVERDEQQSRVSRLEEENDELQDARASLEAEVRSLRRQLEATSLQLKHRDLDGKCGSGAVASAAPSAPPVSERPAEPEGVGANESEDVGEAVAPSGGGAVAVPPAVAAAAAAGGLEAQGQLLPQRAAAALEQFSMLHCAGGSAMSKKQATAGLVALQGQLQAERSRRSSLEGRMRKDRERMTGLFDLAERQREEIQFLRQRLHEQLVESQHWSSFRGNCSRSGSKGSKTSNTFPRQVSAPVSSSAFARQVSAPTRLPCVA